MDAKDEDESVAEETEDDDQEIDYLMLRSSSQRFWDKISQLEKKYGNAEDSYDYVVDPTNYRCYPTQNKLKEIIKSAPNISMNKVTDNLSDNSNINEKLQENIPIVNLGLISTSEIDEYDISSDGEFNENDEFDISSDGSLIEYVGNCSSDGSLIENVGNSLSDGKFRGNDVSDRNMNQIYNETRVKPCHVLLTRLDSFNICNSIRTDWLQRDSSTKKLELLRNIPKTIVDGKDSVTGFESGLEDTVPNKVVTDINGEINVETTTKLGPENVETTTKPGVNNIETSTKPGANVETMTEPGVNVEISPKPGVNVEISPKPGVNVEISPKPGVNVEISPKPGVNVEISPKPGVNVEISPKPGVNVEISPKPGVNVEISPKPGVNVEISPKPGVNVEISPKPGVNVEISPKPGVNVEISPKPGVNVEISPKPGVNVEISPKPGVNVEISPKPGVNVEISPKPGVNVEISPKPGVNVEISPKPGVNVEISPKPGVNVEISPKPGANVEISPKPGANVKITPKRSFDDIGFKPKRIYCFEKSTRKCLSSNPDFTRNSQDSKVESTPEVILIDTSLNLEANLVNTSSNLEGSTKLAIRNNINTNKDVENDSNYESPCKKLKFDQGLAIENSKTNAISKRKTDSEHNLKSKTKFKSIVESTPKRLKSKFKDLNSEINSRKHESTNHTQSNSSDQQLSSIQNESQCSNSNNFDKEFSNTNEESSSNELFDWRNPPRSFYSISSESSSTLTSSNNSNKRKRYSFVGIGQDLTGKKYSVKTKQTSTIKR